jgi:TusA-related sulfurtransferase
MKHTLDITQDKCPLTFIKTAHHLSKMEAGEILEILISDGEPLESVPKELEEYGHEVLNIEKISETQYKITVKKAL